MESAVMVTDGGIMKVFKNVSIKWKSMWSRINEKIEHRRQVKESFKHVCNVLSRYDRVFRDCSVEEKPLDIDIADYMILIANVEKYRKLSKERGLINKVRMIITRDKMLNMITDMRLVRYVSMKSLCDFTQFFTASKVLFPSDTISASISYAGYIEDQVIHFRLNIKTNVGRKNVTKADVCIRDHFTPDGIKMSIETTKHISENRDATTTNIRETFDVLENYPVYDDAWDEICNYIADMFEEE